jgi:hypothetical protein
MIAMAPASESSLERDRLLHQIAHRDQQQELEGVELGELVLAHASQDEPDEDEDERGADDDVHGSRLLGQHEGGHVVVQESLGAEGHSYQGPKRTPGACWSMLKDSTARRRSPDPAA